MAPSSMARVTNCYGTDVHQKPGIPLELPEGISRAHYMAYKGMAAAAAPERLKTRKTGI